MTVLYSYEFSDRFHFHTCQYLLHTCRCVRSVHRALELYLRVQGLVVEEAAW